MLKVRIHFSHIFKRIAIGLLVALLVLVFSKPAFAATGILKQINFQGKVVNANGTNVANGNYDFQFKIYTAASGGSPIWTETWNSGTSQVTVTDGIFRVALGTYTAFPGSIDFNTDNIYLSINFNSDGEMDPRIRFAAVPYAFNALKVAGLTVTDTTGTFTLAAGKTLTVNNTLTFTGTDSTTITFQGTDTYVGRATTDTLTNKTIGITGLTFSGATTDITTTSGEALVITPNGVAALTLGTSGAGNTTSITLATDSTGDAEVVLPDNSIGTAEINDGSDTPGDEECLTYELTGTQFEWQACGSGGATAWDAIGDPAGAGVIAFGQTVQTLDYTITTANASLFSFNFTNSGGTAGTDSGLVINNALSANTTGDLNTENLLLIQQLDTTAGGTTVVDNALKIDVVANSGITDGIEITNSVGNITNGINLVDTAGGTFTTGIVFSGTFTNLFDSGGTLISSTEFNRLDGTTAALVDQDDFISGDGVGGTSSGSGMEAGTGGIGLLQGCAANEILKWNDASSVWACAADATGGGGTTTTITKSANQAANQSSTTMQNVTELVFAMTASKTYIIEAYIPVDDSNTTADLKYTVTVPTGATLNLFNNTYSTAAAVITCNIIASAQACTTTVNSAVNFIRMHGFVANGTTAGNFQVQFAQSTSTAASFPVIKKGSTLFYTPTAGADLAETYFTNDTSIAPGDVVSIDPGFHTGVKKSTSTYDKNLLGIISTNPGLLLGEGGGNGMPVPVALAGQVPVKVSAENGAIQVGDLLTSSSRPGVAMKATKAGPVLGQALTPFEGDHSAGSGQVGEVIVFIKTSYFYGSGVASFLSGFTQETAELSSNELGKLALTKLIEQKEELAASVDLSEIITDRLAAGLEVITPKVITQELTVDKIQASIGSDIVLNLTTDGKFVVNNEKGEQAITFDSQGNAYFAGVVTANKVKANQIEGLEIITSQISKLNPPVADQNDNLNLKTEELGVQIAGVSTSSAGLSTSEVDQEVLFETGKFNLDLTVLGALNANGGLIVLGPSEFGSQTAFKGDSIFHALAEFIGSVIFRGDVAFLGRPTFNKDTGGFAVIERDADFVDITLEKEYETTPIVSTNFTFEEFKKEDGTADDQSIRRAKLFEQGYTFMVVNRTKKGFTIVLNKKATEDIAFSWVALAVKDAKTSLGKKPVSQIKAEALPTLMPTSSPTPEASITSEASPSADTN